MTTINEQSVADVIGQSPQASRLFDQLGIPWAASTDSTFGDLCQAAGLEPSIVRGVLFDSSAASDRITRALDDRASLSELVDHIVVRHHGYLRRKLPLMQLLLDRAILIEGDRCPSLRQVEQVFRQLRRVVGEHMIMEEQVLFPLIRELDGAARRGTGYRGGIHRSISSILHDHGPTEQLMVKLRQLTGDYNPPLDCCPPYAALVKELRELECDMLEHTRKEVDLLLPRAQKVEEGLLKQTAVPAHR